MSHASLWRTLAAALAAGALAFGALSAHRAETIEIQFHLEGPSENPAWDPDGSILLATANAAASYWESIFLSPEVRSLDLEWDNDIDPNEALAYWQYDPVGKNNIEVSSNAAWWADPTPYASEEFTLGPSYYLDLSPTQQSDWFNGPTPPVLEVGWTGAANPGTGAVGNHDLLTALIHELGHELGVRDDVGSVFPVYSIHVGGAAGVEAQADANHPGHLLAADALMEHGIPIDRRELPSALDALVASHATGHFGVSLPRTEFIDVNNDFSNSLNWIGGLWAPLHDATVRRSGNVPVNATASADMSFEVLRLLNDSFVNTGNHVITVTESLRIVGDPSTATPPRFIVNIGGAVDADYVRLANHGQLAMFGGLATIGTLELVGPVTFTDQFSMLPGATLRVDELVGFGNQLQFLGNLQIGDDAPAPGSLSISTGQSLWVLGEMAVGPTPGGSGLVSVLSGGQADTGPLTVGSDVASGTVVVRGYNVGGGILSDWDVAGDLTIGANPVGFGAGTMRVEDLATCDVAGSAVVRGAPAALGRLVVDSGGSFDVDHALHVQPYGRVELSAAGSKIRADEIVLWAGGVLSDGPGTTIGVNKLTGFGAHPAFPGSLELGRPGGSLAIMSIGAGQSLDVAEAFTVGETRQASLWISSGGTAESDRTYVGRTTAAAGSYVNVIGSGARWDIADQFFVAGDETTGSGGATLSVGDGGIVDVDDSTTVWPGGVVNVGLAATPGTLSSGGTLRILAGGTVAVANAGELRAQSIDLTGGGALNTAGPNATVWTNGLIGLEGDLVINGNLRIGWGGSLGAVTLGDGQALEVTGVLHLGEGSTSGLGVAGGSATVGQARIGDGGAGTLIVNGDGSTVTQTGPLYAGYFGAGATGSLHIDAGGAVLGGGQVAYLGAGAGTSGTATIHGANSRWTGLSALYVGGNAAGAVGNGLVTVDGGGLLDVDGPLKVWSTGKVELLGSEIRADSFVVEPGGVFVHRNGSLAVRGGTFAPGADYDYSIDGQAPGQSPVLVLANGASFTVPHTLFVGVNYGGQLELADGAMVHSYNGRVGWAANTSDGRIVVTGPGSRWTNDADLEVGVRHRGVMTIADGGVVENTIGAIAAVAGSTGSVLVAGGGRWLNSGNLYVGGRLAAGGPATLAIANAEVAAAGVVVWPQGEVSLDGGTISAANIDLPGGALRGVGELALSSQFVNDGLIAPGAPVGTLTARGADYFQTTDGVLAVEVGGSRLVDRLRVFGGAASLAGGLHVSRSGAYIPALGAEFEVLWAESGRVGQFDPLASVLEPIGGGLAWSIEYRPQSVVLHVIHAAFAEADFDEDGDVDHADLLRWNAGFGLAGAALHSQGDADADHDVDGADLLVWQRQLGVGIQRPVEGAAPEPAAFALMIAAISAMGAGVRMTSR